MPIRIYALAKEIKVDSKELVEICAKAGITNKGSALASLTDDEVDRVKAFIQGGDTRTKVTTPVPTPSAPTKVIKNIKNVAPVRPTRSPASSKPAVLPPTKSPVATPEPETPPEEPVPEAPAAEAPAVEPPPVEPPAAPADAPSQVAGFSREDYIGPGGSMGKPRVITSIDKRPDKGGGASEPKEPKPQQKKEPVVRVAAIPDPPQTTPKKKSNEPAPQKPIMTLPVDAIRNAKTGSRAPLEQFTRQQDKKRDRDAGGAGGRGGGGTGRSTSGGGNRASGSGPAVAGGGPVQAEPGGASRGGRRRGGKSSSDEAGGERDKKLATMAGSRAARQQKRRRMQNTDDDDGDVRRRRRRLQRKGGTNTAAPRKEKVVLEFPCTVRSLSEAGGVPSAAIQRELMKMGVMATINQELEDETAELLADELEIDVEFRQPASLEDKLRERFEADDDPVDLVPRPPVITFLGHVDHGKTSLLDRIIGIDVVSGEAGGITQHIRAYKLGKDSREIAFVDTPGHEAFTEMRARGANVTDIAVLVVAADDGVMPQTEEAISHARAAEVPIVVAMNKCDLPGADAQRVYQDLSTHELLPVEWGGDVEVIKTSAITGEGIDDLLETLLITADIREYKANPKRHATGTCLEAEQHGKQGVVAKIIVQNGTLSVGDVIVCGGAHGRVKAMYDTLNPRKKLTEVGPSTPVNLVGLDVAPEAGERMFQMDDIADARQIAEERQQESRSKSLSGRSIRVSFEEFQRRLEEGRLGDSTADVTVLNLIVRADVRGSIEAIQKELEKLDHPEVQVRVLQATVGGISSADVTLADASDAVIVGFNVIPDESARTLAEERGVEIRRYDIIYKVTADIKAMLEGKLKPEERVMELGRALVQQTFTISRVGTVAGCRVLAGTIERGCRVRVNRNGRGIGEYPLDSLRRVKDDAKEVREGFECGMKLSGFNDLKEGDVLEAYKIEEFARTL